MSEQIKEGDLVLILRGGCKHSIDDIGGINKVTRIVETASTCYACNIDQPRSSHAWVETPSGMVSCKPLSWLLKINPPARETETERDTEETA